jgi:phage tail sheath gpL-like
MSGSVAFSNIPSNLRVPFFYVEFDPSRAASSAVVQRTLIIGQATTTVPATPSPEFVESIGWAQQNFGAGSQLANMVAAYRANDTVGEIWALPLPDATGSTAASGSIVITGTPTANGTLYLYVNGTLVTVGVATGQTATQIAANVAAAINAATTSTAVNAALTPPVTAAASAGTVTITANNKGSLGAVPLALNWRGAKAGETTPAGLGVAITAMSGGATDPSLANIATWLGTEAFDFIVCPYSDVANLGYLTTTMNDSTGRWSYSSQIFGHVFSARVDTVSDLLTLGTSLNDQHLTIIGYNALSPSSAWLRLAARVGSIVPSLKNQPNRPLQTLLAYGVLGEAESDDISFANKQSLLSAGIALEVPSTSGPQVLRMVTTYQTNKYGVSDTSYLDTETLFQCMAVTRQLKAAITTNLPRALLADDGTRLPATPADDTPVMVTPTVVRGILIAEYLILEDLLLTERDDLFAKGLVVQRNSQDASRLDVLFDPYYVSGLRIFAVLNQFHLQAQASEA